MIHTHTHPHDHAERHAEEAHGASHGEPVGARRMAMALAVGVLVMAAEAVGGFVADRLALLADAGHMLTDVGALALALLAIVWGARPADVKRTFGYRRLEVLAAQI